MPELIKIAHTEELPAGSAKVVTVGAMELAIFNVDGDFFAVEDRCPHNGASLGLGTVEGGVVACPWHAWKFDLRTGRRVGNPATGLRQFAVSIEDGFLWVAPQAEAEPSALSDGIQRYLVRYGALGWVGCFGSIEKIDCAHKDRIVVHTSRGLEVGEVLATPDATALNRERPAGEVLRRVTSADEFQAKSQSAESQAMLETCLRLLLQRDLPVEVVDCEQLLDGEKIVLYHLGTSSTGLEELAETLGKDCTAQVIFQPVIDPVPVPREGGCGSGGCGCSH